MNRVQKVSMVIDYIESNLNQKADLDTIAEAVHYSKFYLHRVFSETLGMTIHEYQQRRRLTEAAKLLVFSRQSILDIALSSGYGSQQSFTAMFTAMYKQSPNQYRANEKFYPLQLRFTLEGSYGMLHATESGEWRIEPAAREDIPSWMRLVRLVIDGFPNLQEAEHIRVLERNIDAGQALILKDGETAVGILLFSRQSGSIDFMGTHPLYRNRGIPQAFLTYVMGELVQGKRISITTYRENDKADTGQRREIMALGFAEAELLVEFGYPTQRFVLPEERSHG